MKELKERDKEQYEALVNELKLILLLRSPSEKLARITSIPSLSLGFSVYPSDMQFEENENPETVTIRVAEQIARRILIGLGEEIQEDL